MMALATRKSGQNAFSSDASALRRYRRSHRQCLLPLPPRCVPPVQDRYTTMNNSTSIQCRAAPSESDGTPYFDALVRTFLLGVISGGLFESYGALTTLWDMSAQTANVWAMAKAAYAPHFVADHVIGFCFWTVFYASECFGLRQASLSSKGNLASFMAALPKTLIPLQFSALKSKLAKVPADVDSTKSAATVTLQAPLDRRGLDKVPKSIGTSARSVGIAVEEESPFVKDRAARPGLAPGQWDPALGGRIQAETAKQSYLEGMYYCMGTAPRNGLKTDTIYNAYVMGTRVAYWKSADGKVNTVSSTCTHRGAQLANGWIDTINGETCVRCPYHAWAFSGDGTVKDIPVQPEGGYPKRPLQQSFETTLEDGKVWIFWGRSQIPVEERPPVPGSRVDAMEGMLSTTVSNTLKAPHHNTMEVLASESSLAASARTLLGVLNCNIEVTKEVEESWASRTVTYILTPTKTRLSPLVPQGLPEAIRVTASAQLPSSVVTTFHLSQGRCLRLEAHVLPEKYSISRLTITAHHNFAGWSATGPFVRDMLATVSEGLQGQAESRPFKHRPEIKPMQKSEKLASAFANLRCEFDKMGYGIPAEIAAMEHRVDM